MSAGFFGKYFRRDEKQRPDEAAPPAAPPAPPASAPAPESRPPESQPAPRPAALPSAGLSAPAVDVAEPEPPTRGAAGGVPPEVVAQDPVLALLMQRRLVSEASIEAALRRPASGEPVWRGLLGQPGVDRDAVLAVAAEVGGYARVAVGADQPSDNLALAVLGLLAAPMRQRFMQAGLFPFDLRVDPLAGRQELALVAADPGHPKVQELLDEAGLRATLYFAPPKEIAARAHTLPLDLLDEDRGASDTHTDIERALAAGGHAHRPTPSADVQAGPEAAAAALDGGIVPAQPLESFGGDGVADAPGGPTLSPGHPPSEPAAEPAPAPAAEAPPEPEPEAEEVEVDGEALQAIRAKDRVIAALLKSGAVTAAHVMQAARKQEVEESREALWRILVTITGVSAEAVYREAARVYAFPVADFKASPPDPEFARSVVETFSEEHRNELMELRVFPHECDLEYQTGAIKLIFVTHDPTRPDVHRLMQRLKLERFELRYAPEPAVRAALLEAFPKKNEYLERMQEGGGAFDLGTSYQEDDQLVDEDALEAEISRSTLINLFEATLIEGVRQGASDIHIWPNADKRVEIHFRVDGRLTHWHTEAKVHPEALLAVIKDNAMNVDRFERDMAQDGFIQRWIDDALIRFRVSVLPIANAAQELRSESIVIRILDDRKVITDLSKLGLDHVARDRFGHAISQPHGMVILTGPTGSGKSTTLVAALHQTVTPEVNVLTVEDPVEYIIPGVRQIKLNHKLGLEGALRAILRHDPDVVMVGEMRDRQTAEVAIKLANTGHLTFSTLHTNDAPSAVSRLYKMGIEPFLIAYAINLVVAQRLIRTLCPDCKTVDDDPDPVMLEKLGFSQEEIATTTIYQKGHNPNCKTCKGTGYKGRRAVAEALHFSRKIRHLIVEADKMIDEGKIKQVAVEEGMLTLQDSAREVVKAGDTDIREMIRVVTTESGA